MTAPVVFLHGLGRTQRSLTHLRKQVERAGFSTWAITYPSRRMTIAELADYLANNIRAQLGDGPFHAVTHSMGGILVRHLTAELNFARVVMLAPPNRGSRVAKALRELPLYKSLMGPAAQELANPEGWPAPPHEFAVIAGRSGATVGNPPSWMIATLRLLAMQGPHDGTVLVEETKLDGMADFVEVPASHTWIAKHPMTRKFVIDFLRHGSFGQLALPQVELPK